MDGLWSDLRQSWRVWRRAPGTALVLIVLIGLGTGGMTALLRPLSTLLLAPFPFPDSEQLVRIGGGIPLFSTYTKTFDERERLGTVFQNVMGYAPVPPGISSRVSTSGRPREKVLTAVTPEFFETLRVPLAMGRSFVAEETNSRVVVLSNRMWRSDLLGASDVIGMTITVNQVPRTIIGVAPDSLDFPAGTDAWLPFGSTYASESSAQFVGRLRDGPSVSDAAEQLRALDIKQGTGPTGRIGGSGPLLETFETFLQRDARANLIGLWSISALFLTMACAACANLLLAQAVLFRFPIAVKLALGASRHRLIGQLLTQTATVVGVGVCLGLWLSTLASQWLQGLVPQAGSVNPSLPGSLALIVGLIPVLTIACGLGPALVATNHRASLHFAANARARTGITRRVRPSSGEFLVGLQMAVALVLLINTGLLLRSLTTTLGISTGVEAHDVAVVSVDLPQLPELVKSRLEFFQVRNLDPFAVYGPRHGTLVPDLMRSLEPQVRADEARRVLFFREGMARLGGLPEVIEVGVVDPAPFTSEARFAVQSPFHVYKTNPLEASSPPLSIPCLQTRANAEGLSVLGIRLVEGRLFDEGDILAEAGVKRAVTSCLQCIADPKIVAIVDQTMAEYFWPGEDPIGKRFYELPFPPRTVVGVVRDVPKVDIRSRKVATVYYPFSGARGKGTFVAKLRAGASLKSFNHAMDRALSSLAADVPEVSALSLTALAAQPHQRLLLTTSLLSTFAILAVIVAGLGVHSMATLMAASRRREMAIRSALGASAIQICKLGILRSGRLAIVAIPVGLCGAVVVARAFAHLLVQVGTNDPTTYLMSSAVLVIVIGVGGVLPTLRELRTPISRALRPE